MITKKIILISGLLVSFGINAVSLDSLKSVPASQYDLGKLTLELSAYLFTDKLKDERIDGTGFKIDKFKVEEKEESLLLVGDLLGRTKDISDSQCSSVLNRLTNNSFFSNLPKKVWPGLAEKEYVELSEQVKLSIKLISKENANFFVQC